MKSILFAAVACAMTMGLFCCSKDDTEKADIELSLTVLNLLGEPVSDFSKDDPIIFDFLIKNNSAKAFIVNTDLLNDHLFRVFDENGNDYGVPWSGRFCYFSGDLFSINSHSELHLYCAWSGVNLNNKYRCVYPLCKEKDNEPLPEGNYYTSYIVPRSKDHSFTINGDRNKTTIKFVIR